MEFSLTTAESWRWYCTYVILVLGAVKKNVSEVEGHLRLHNKFVGQPELHRTLTPKNTKRNMDILLNCLHRLFCERHSRFSIIYVQNGHGYVFPRTFTGEQTMLWTFKKDWSNGVCLASHMLALPQPPSQTTLKSSVFHCNSQEIKNLIIPKL